MLDILHHVPPPARTALLQGIHEALAPGGILILKDIDSHPRWKVFFTWVLDMLMSPAYPPKYADRAVLRALLVDLGFDVKIHTLPDLLPYPHVMYICRKVQRQP